MADRETAPGRSPEKQDDEDSEMDKEDEEGALYEVERVIGKSKIKVSLFSSRNSRVSCCKKFTFLFLIWVNEMLND